MEKQGAEKWDHYTGRILIFYSRGEMKPIVQHRGEAQ